MESISVAIVAVSFFFFWALFLFSRSITKSYKKQVQLNTKDFEEVDIRLVSILHAGLVAIYAIYSYFTQVPAFTSTENPFVGQYPWSAQVVSFSVGYFLFDLIAFSLCDYKIALTWKEQNRKVEAHKRAKKPSPIGGLVYVLHHSFAAYGLIVATQYGVLPVILMALLGTEATTPFLNISYSFEKFKQDQSIIYKAAGLLFVVSWIPCRIVSCGWSFYWMISKYQLMFELLPAPVLIGCLAVPFFFFLNCFWYTKIISRAIRVARKSDSTKDE